MIHLSLKDGKFKEKYSCQICGENTSTIVQLENHIIQSHTIDLKDYVEMYDDAEFIIDGEFDENREYFYRTVKINKPKKRETEIEEKTRVKINGEFCDKIKIEGIETYKRIKMKVVKSKKTGKKITIGGLTEEDMTYIPNIKENFYLGEDFHKQLIMTLSDVRSDNILLSGDTGFGKTSSVLQIAGLMNQPVVRIALTGDTKVKDIFQEENFDKESMKVIYEDKAILKAIRNGYWLLVDEFSAGNPQVMFMFFQIMEEHKITALDGSIVEKNPFFKLIITDNRIGNPNWFRYVGTNQQNFALLNRIRTIIIFDKFSREFDVLKDLYPDIDKKIIKTSCEIAELLRKNEDYDYGLYISFRDLLNVLENFRIFCDLKKSFQLAYVNKLSEEDKKSYVLELLQRKIATNDFVDKVDISTLLNQNELNQNEE